MNPDVNATPGANDDHGAPTPPEAKVICRIIESPESKVICRVIEYPESKVDRGATVSPEPGIKAACLLIVAILLGATLAPIRPARATDIDQFESYRRVASFGLEPVLLAIFANDSVVAAIDSLPEGTILRFHPASDEMGDILAWRQGRMRVAAVDDDRDLDTGSPRADSDSDCYLVDVNGDGILDRLLDYTDDDGDNHPDRMDLYEITPGGIGADGVGITVVFDLDDDGRLLALTDYDYHANRDMWRSDFSGNVCLVAGSRNESTGIWTSAFENPFCFYDNDGDGLSDEALRLEGTDLILNSVRWSFDADGDATADSPYDYDFSLNGVGLVRAPESFAQEVKLRDGGVLRFVAWNRARELARWGLWSSTLLVWDEEDRNVAPESEVPTRERWEGVIAEPFMGFPQIGGPACGRSNKRYEIDRDNSGRLGIYISDVDQRIHLLGAEHGELAVVLPGDPGVRRTIAMDDSDGNGYFDTWTWTAESLPRRERIVVLGNESARRIPVEAAAIRKTWPDRLRAAHKQSRWDYEQLGTGGMMGAQNQTRRWWTGARERGDPLAVAAERSAETERYLNDLSLWDIGGGFLARDPAERTPGSQWNIERTVPLAAAVIINTELIPQKKRKDLDLFSNVELTVGSARITGQPEDWDADGMADAVYFPPTDRAAGGEAASAVLEINPAHALARSEELRADPYFGSSIAFESIPAAYRTYEGRLDFFVKRRPALILRSEIGDYHAPQVWGMDPFEVGAGPGLGGLFVEEADGWLPLFGPHAFRGHRVIADGPARMLIESVAEVAGIRAVRRWSLERGDQAITEEILLEAPAGIDSLRIAAAIPVLTEHGSFEGTTGIWSHGLSIPEGGEIGLAGAVLDDRSTSLVLIEGNIAIRIGCQGRDRIRLVWIAGAAAYGDSTAQAWRSRAERALAACRGRVAIRIDE